METSTAMEQPNNAKIRGSADLYGKIAHGPTCNLAYTWQNAHTCTISFE